MAGLMKQVSNLDRRIQALEQRWQMHKGEIVKLSLPVFQTIEDLENIPPELVSCTQDMYVGVHLL